MSAGYVYVLAFTNGTVKVGRTQDTGKRLNAHKSDARKFGLTVTDEWVSPLHTEWLENEADLKVLAASLGGTPLRQEYFKGVEFAAVAEKARELTFTPPEAGEQDPAGTCCTRPDDGIITAQRAIALEAFSEVTRNLTQLTYAAYRLLDQGKLPSGIEQMGGATAPLVASIMRLLLAEEERMLQHALQEKEKAA